MLEDDTLKTTFKNELEKVFILSDNQANNRFFEFTGQDYLNKKFTSKGFLIQQYFTDFQLQIPQDLKAKS